ncbi:MAG: hypothetical protein RLZ63_360 [Pseudomonadota bacterium]
MKRIITLAAFFAASSVVNAQTAYLCIPDGASGISWNKSSKRWEQTKFNVQNVKLLLKKTNSGWEWSDFGESYSQKCGEINNVGFLNCDIIGGQLKFNKNTLRFMTTYLFGYVDGYDTNDDTPSIRFGKCSPL